MADIDKVQRLLNYDPEYRIPQGLRWLWVDIGTGWQKRRVGVPRRCIFRTWFN